MRNHSTKPGGDQPPPATLANYRGCAPSIKVAPHPKGGEAPLLPLAAGSVAAGAAGATIWFTTTWPLPHPTAVAVVALVSVLLGASGAGCSLVVALILKEPQRSWLRPQRRRKRS
jgi:hypothetical protein